MKNMTIYYDEEGDYLEITNGDISGCFFDNLGDGIFQIVDKKNDEIRGISIHNFKKRTKNDTLTLDLPFKINFSV
jgi:hypothetical protein